MFTDNGGLIFAVAKKGAFFFRMDFNGAAHYIAQNRAARRMVLSKRFYSYALKNGLNISFQDELITVK